MVRDVKMDSMAVLIWMVGAEGWKRSSSAALHPVKLFNFAALVTISS